MPKVFKTQTAVHAGELSAVPGRGRGGRAFEGALCAFLVWFVANDLGLLELVPVLRGWTFVPVAALVAGAALGLTWARAVGRWLAGASVGLWLLVAFTPLASALLTPLKTEDAPARADAVVVLQAGVQRDDDFDAPTLERMVHGLELLHAGYAPRLIVTEVPKGGSNVRATGALMSRLGVRGALFPVSPVQTTRDEALRCADLCRAHGWKTILLVTSPAHSKRAKLTFQKLGLRVLSSPCRESAFDFENLSAPGAQGRTRAFAEAVREIVGLRAYRARGWA